MKQRVLDTPKCSAFLVKYNETMSRPLKVNDIFTLLNPLSKVLAEFFYSAVHWPRGVVSRPDASKRDNCYLGRIVLAFEKFI